MFILLNLIAVKSGGQLTRSKNFLQYIASQNHENIMYVVLVNASFHKEYEQCCRIHYVTLNLPSKGLLSVASRLIYENLFISHLISQYSCDMYLTFSHSIPLFLSIPSIVGVSDVAPFSPVAFSKSSLTNKLRLVLLRYTIKHAAFSCTIVIALSNYCKDILVSHGVDPSKIVIIHNGVNQNCTKLIKSNSINLRFSDKADNRYILSVSHFYSYKDFECLIDAYTMLPALIRSDYKLIIVGRPNDLDYFNKIVKLIDLRNLNDHITLITDCNAESLDTIYSQASLFVFTSLVENCPNILLEALSYGLPIICSEALPMKEFAGNSVKYYEQSNSIQLSKHMVFLLSSPTESNKLRLLALTKSKDYSWIKFSESVINLAYNYYSKYSSLKVLDVNRSKLFR